MCFSLLEAGFRVDLTFNKQKTKDQKHFLYELLKHFILD